MSTDRTRTIAVANEKGGVGKTVTAINLGAALSRAGHKVLLVDMDPQFNATRGLGVKDGGYQVSIYDLIKNHRNGLAREAVLQTPWEGLWLIPSHADLAGAEVELVNKLGRENRLKRALSPVTEQFDYVVVDTPPSLSLLTVNVFAYACEVLVPCQTQPFAYSALDELFDTIDAICEEINPEVRVSGILPTLFDSRTRVSRSILQRLQTDARYAPYLLKTIIRINTAIAESADEGRPVVFSRPTSTGARDYEALAKELAT